MYSKTLTTKTKVRFQDCDPFNHLNNAKYIDYFINAREDQILEHYGINIFELAQQQNISWMVASNQIAYFAPANIMETITIQSELIQHTDKSLLVEMTMWNDAMTQLKSLFWIKFIHVDLKIQRATTHQPQLMALFDAVAVPVKQNTFEERQKAILVR